MEKSEYASQHLKLALLNPFVVHYVGNYFHLASAGGTCSSHHANAPGGKTSVKIYLYAGENRELATSQPIDKDEA